MPQGHPSGDIPPAQEVGVPFSGPLRFTCSRLQSPHSFQGSSEHISPTWEGYSTQEPSPLAQKRNTSPDLRSLETHILLTGGWKTRAQGRCPAFPVGLALTQKPSLPLIPSGICQIVGAEGTESMPSSIFFLKNLTSTFPAWADCHMLGRVSPFHNLLFSPSV